MAEQGGPPLKATKTASSPAVVAKFTKAPGGVPGSTGAEVLLTIEVVPIQAQKKMKVSLDSTNDLKHFTYIIKVLEYGWKNKCVLYFMYLIVQRKLVTYLPKNDDVLELKYKGTDIVQLTTLDVYYPRTRATEIVKFYPQTTVFGIIQSLEQKKMSMVDSIKLTMNGTVLDNRDALLSSYGITERASLEYSDASSVDDAPRSSAPVAMKPKSASFIAELRTVQSSENIKRTGVPIIPAKKDTNNAEPEQNNELLNALKNRRSKVEVSKTQSEGSPAKSSATPAARPTSKSFMAPPVPSTNRSPSPTPPSKAASSQAQVPPQGQAPPPQDQTPPTQETKSFESVKSVEEPKPVQEQPPAEEAEFDAELDNLTKMLEQQLQELKDEEGLDEVLNVAQDGVKQFNRRGTINTIPVAPPPPEDDVTKFTREWKEFETQYQPTQGNFDKENAIKTLAVLLQKIDESNQIQNHLQTYPVDALISIVQQSLAVVSHFG